MNALRPFAEQMLDRFGEFLPFGAAMRTNGAVISVGADTGQERSPSRDVIAVLEQGFAQQAEAGELRAAGICYDARIVPPGQTEKTDAIAMRLQHLAGDTVDVFLPYKRGTLGGLKFGELFACVGSLHVFPGETGAT